MVDVIELLELELQYLRGEVYHPDLEPRIQQFELAVQALGNIKRLDWMDGSVRELSYQAFLNDVIEEQKNASSGNEVDVKYFFEIQQISNMEGI